MSSQIKASTGSGKALGNILMALMQIKTHPDRRTHGKGVLMCYSKPVCEQFNIFVRAVC
jgi:hypothetical protein